MMTVCFLSMCVALSNGLIRADQLNSPASDAQPASTPDAAAKEPGALVSLWVVRFDPSVPRDRLPINVQSEAVIGIHGRPDAQGRVRTDGLASQRETARPIVESGGFRLIVRNGHLITEPMDPANTGGTPAWQIVAAPKLAVLRDQKASLTVGRPVAYLSTEKDDCLKLQEMPGVVEGVSVDLTLQWIKPEGIRFSELTLRVSRVSGREPVPNVPLEVGKPILESRETNLGLTLDTGRIGIIPLPERVDEAPILVFITAVPQK